MDRRLRPLSRVQNVEPTPKPWQPRRSSVSQRQQRQHRCSVRTCPMTAGTVVLVDRPFPVLPDRCPAVSGYQWFHSAALHDHYFNSPASSAEHFLHAARTSLKYSTGIAHCPARVATYRGRDSRARTSLEMISGNRDQPHNARHTRAKIL
ncbi:hypothetical protein BDV96DRAFT_6764 [Lophiotrema nucula]|uniref:Uncharacterized protein n=1 Tax=Lophiotrema nucula TaxID=690887 RepID=A0A6A5ZUY8_9PLEO|nr:hypothetical protein BDV96DRAFT_6764 [Lophiotrema nucula]